MYHLGYSEFYITNVCNLNCTNCNRFNNFNFKGHWRWQDHEQEYKEWAKLISIDEIGILGGEPLLNPDFSNWLNGVANLWPDSRIRIITNGTRILNVKNLYQMLLPLKGRVTLEVNCHNLEQKSKLESDICELLSDIRSIDHINLDRDYDFWKSSYNNIKDDSWPECNSPADFSNLSEEIQQECENLHNISPGIHKRKFEKLVILDDNNIKAELLPADSFLNSTLIFDQQKQTLSLHKNDPAKSMEVCCFKVCHHFIDGKLYKCGPVALLPEFVKQFVVERDQEQDRLIHSYQPASLDWSKDDLDEFIDNLKNATPIPQCSLCPSKMNNVDFSASSKKIKIKQLD